jgi:hypothetical protein
MPQPNDLSRTAITESEGRIISRGCCAGEHLTVEFIKEFLRKVWKDKISFVKLDLENREKVPVNPGQSSTEAKISRKIVAGQT